MSAFHAAQNFSIHGGEFVTIQNSHVGPNGKCIDILLDAAYPDAAVDSEARKYDPMCFPGTREQYIHDITSWATTSANDSTLPMYWMRGPAGVGKSAIAQTCAERVKESGQLGAAFFFSINGRSDPRCFFPTLAYQLAAEFPDYRSIVDDRVYRDKTLVKKRMSSQFNSLIVEPLQELERQGKGIGSCAIFVDGLDECGGNDAQSEIIELIAASVHSKTTPFRWAIFSRPEPHIQSTFDKGHIFPICQRVLLPVSREADEEIETYLKGGFTNILLHRDLLSLSGSWPTREEIQILVEASDGLFAYPAAIIRFVDHHSFLEFKETLQAVLTMIASRTTHLSTSMAPFAELDALYVLLTERIPKDSLPAVQLLLVYLFIKNYSTGAWYVGVICNSLGLSETGLRGICRQLSAVLEYRDAPLVFEFDEAIDLKRSFYMQDIPSWLPPQLKWQCHGIHGTVHLHHKSFYDFLIDPTRSSTFCVKVPPMLKKLFNHLVERHHHFAQGLDIRPIKLSLIPAPGPFNLLSWPHKSEFVNSCLCVVFFNNLHQNLEHDGSMLPVFMDSIEPKCLQKLAALDYHKALVSSILVSGVGLHGEAQTVNLASTVRVLPGIIFGRVDRVEFKAFNSGTFFTILEKLEKLGVFSPYRPNLFLALASIARPFSQRKKLMKASGRYKVGHGGKAIYYYWEFDMELGYFRDFLALNFEEAMKIYETEKSKMWEKDWVPSVETTNAFQGLSTTSFVMTYLTDPRFYLPLTIAFVSWLFSIYFFT
ncbi:hypothetical protein AN958_11240 [Leucoagaricus sp. SymC.cos]|nr:hypothetical protein AN958_11240 [Leucoagaricus sp. SymC.cos]